jgi:hypothetical protein
LLELGTDTGSPQTPFLGEGPKLKKMMVIEVTPAAISINRRYYSLLRIIQIDGQGEKWVMVKEIEPAPWTNKPSESSLIMFSGGPWIASSRMFERTTES